jgi:uncharacterized membrane protein
MDHKSFFLPFLSISFFILLDFIIVFFPPSLSSSFNFFFSSLYPLEKSKEIRYKSLS